ncbi:MAG: ATP-binding cassette domain-containing protein [Alphaproteobacteria bacterium]|nr:ATP-binding cassette domain-containing protein [Alphaproteobacteria bacterium]
MAADPPVIALRDIIVGFGGDPLFQGAELQLTPGMRACLVGRNGSGKSTILKIIARLFEPDSGDLYFEPGLTIGHLPQDVPLPDEGTVAAFVATAKSGVAPRHQVDEVLSRVDLDGERSVTSLSGGESRRAALARALLGDPDVLLLDEPTNHLDLPTIQWLEQTLIGSRKTLLMVSHDRAFLKAVTTDTYWLHRRKLRHNPRNYADFDRWNEQVIEAEAKAARRLDQKLKGEQHWLVHGITARRRRNQGRLRKLEMMRQQRQALLTGKSLAKVEAESGPLSGRLVIEAKNIAKAFGERSIVGDFSTRVLRGDRIGIIGPNGAGKTTLMNLLIGTLAPDSGRLRIGSNLTTAVFDQTRASLIPTDTLWQTLVPGGGDSLNVRGRQRHVVAYLRDFLFDDKQAKAPVATLSGGERNRLLLAKILAKPSNLLVLDEPTNDLDADTLDVLQEMLDDYDGTVLLVSHDREFLDRIVTSTIAVEGDGRVVEYAGGYSDYLHQRAAPSRPPQAAPARQREPSSAKQRPRTAEARKLSYKDQRELNGLPDHIADLETTKQNLETILADPDFYSRDARAYNDAAQKLADATTAIKAAEARWLELEAAREALAEAEGA